MMNEFSINPLGGLNVGASLEGAVNQVERRKRQESQQTEKQDMQAFMAQAYEGDPVAMREVFARNPEIGIQLKQMESDRLAKMGAQNKKIADKANFKYSKAIKFAKTPEEKQAIIQRAIEDPASDLYDDDDIGKGAEELNFDANMLLYTRLGDKGFKALGFGQDKNEGLTSGEREFNALTSGMSPEDVTKAKRIKLKLDQGAGTAKGSISSSQDKIKLSGMKEGMTMDSALNVLDKAKESQSKNGGFALTMNRGLDKLKELDAKGFEPEDIAMVQTFLAGKPLGSYIMSQDEQLYSGAIESMINAIARRESGAAIGEEETQRFFGRYMPQAGDTKARIKQKRNALEGQFKSIRGQSGRVYDALRVTMSEEDKADQAVQSFNSSVLGREVSEQDIIDTLQSNPNLTRKQLFEQLGIQ